MDMGQMGWLAWLIVGGIAGWLTSRLMKTNHQRGLFLDIAVGIVGGFVGGLLFNQFGTSGMTGFSVWSVCVAFTGAVILLAVIHGFNGRRVFKST